MKSINKFLITKTNYRHIPKFIVNVLKYQNKYAISWICYHILSFASFVICMVDFVKRKSTL